MNHLETSQFDRRVLVLAPTSKDASITESLLASAGIAVDVFQRFDALIAALAGGAAAILIPEEVMSSAFSRNLRAVLAEQPPWSDLPVLVLTRPGADSAASRDAFRTLGNVTLLERPLQRTALLSAVQTATRARERQYQIRGHLIERMRAEESLRLADQRKDEFLATLGHELRNPLAPLVSGLQVLKASPAEDFRVRQTLEVMERQTRHLVRLVDDLLEVSRITRGLINIQREAVDLAFVVRSAVETSRPLLEAAGHELTIALPAQPVAVAGDSVRLTQVFANLLTNAAKYTNKGGRIRVTVRQEDERALISVRDNGIGIPAASLASVFDMFTQVDPANRQAQGGLGIGLTLVRTLVAMHGGRVEARSEGLGMGSEFVVELPVHQGVPADAEPPDAQGALPPRRILVVDDNRDAADTLAAHLRSLGAVVSVVHSGYAALDRLTHFAPDAVLLDIGMADLNGYEVARRIRAMPSHAGVLLIALTGWGQEQDYRRSHAAGIDHHLVKPPDMPKLRQILVDSWPPRTGPRRAESHSHENPGCKRS